MSELTYEGGAKVLGEEIAVPLPQKWTFTNANDLLTALNDNYNRIVVLESSVITNRIVDENVSGTYNLDHDLASDWKLTATGSTTITESGMPTGTTTKEFTMKITGEFPLLFPIYWDVVGDEYNGAVWNFFAVQIHNGNNGSQEVTCFISNLG